METIMKTKEKRSLIKAKKMDAMVDTFDELNEDELAQVIGGLINQIDDNALLTFNGKFLNNSARTCYGAATNTILYSEQLGMSTVSASNITSLLTRSGESLNLKNTDTITIS